MSSKWNLMRSQDSEQPSPITKKRSQKLQLHHATKLLENTHPRRSLRLREEWAQPESLTPKKWHQFSTVALTNLLTWRKVRLRRRKCRLQPRHRNLSKVWVSICLTAMQVRQVIVSPNRSGHTVLAMATSRWSKRQAASSWLAANNISIRKGLCQIISFPSGVLFRRYQDLQSSRSLLVMSLWPRLKISDLF